MDERCKRLIEGNDKYHQLAIQLADRLLTSLCAEKQLVSTLCMGDFDVLSAIAQNDADHCMNAIAQRLNVNPSSVTRSVRKLQEDDLVIKEPAPADERRFLLSLTELGKSIYQEMNAQLDQVVQTMYADISPETMQIIFDFSDHCIAHLQNMLDRFE